MKKIRVLIGTAILSASMSIVALAGEWKHEPTGWWYQNDDKSYPVSCWKEIDGKQYYFDERGWLLMNTTTPDGEQVDSNGALIQPAETASHNTVSQGQNSVPPTSSNYTPEQIAWMKEEAERRRQEDLANKPEEVSGGVAIGQDQDFSSAARWSWK